MSALDFLNLDDDSVAEFVSIPVVDGKAGVVVRTQHVRFEVGEYTSVVTTAAPDVGASGKKAVATRRLSKRLSAADATRSLQLVDEGDDDDLLLIGSLTGTGSGVDVKKEKLVQLDVEKDAGKGKEVVENVVASASVGKPKKKKKGVEIEGSSAGTWQKTGERVPYVPEWEVFEDDSLKQYSVCQELLCNLTPPSERDRQSGMLTTEVVKKMFYLACNLAALLPEAMVRWTSVENDHAALNASFQIVSDEAKKQVELSNRREGTLAEELMRAREQLAVEQGKVVQQRLVLEEAKSELQKVKATLIRERAEFEKRKTAEEVEPLKKRVEELLMEREWLIGEGFEQVVTYLLHSPEFNEPLANVYKLFLARGRHAGLLQGYKNSAAGIPIEQCPFYAPDATEAVVNAVQEMEHLRYPYIQALSASSDKSLFFIQELEPVGLKKEIVGKLLGRAGHKRDFSEAVSGEDASPGSSQAGAKKPKPVEEAVSQEVPDGGNMSSPSDVDILYADVGNQQVGEFGDVLVTPDRIANQIVSEATINLNDVAGEAAGGGEIGGGGEGGGEEGDDSEKTP